jgi:hypothetical protein
MSFSQDVYILGALNEVAFLQTHDQTYVHAAEAYFKNALELGPHRPQSLYGLFDVYRMEGNASATIDIGNRIIAEWHDAAITRALSQIPAQSSTK